MITKDELDALTYLPTIRSRSAELKGYRELRPGTKSLLRPIISLGKLNRLNAADQIAPRIVDAVGGPFFLDLNVTPNQQCQGWDELCSPDGNFEAWRNFVGTVDNAVPVALMRPDASERAFIRQVLSIEQRYGVVLVRSRRPGADLPLLQAAIAAVEDVASLLLVLDLGYVRAAVETHELEARRVITALRTAEPTVRIAVLGSSFPRAVSAYGDTQGTLEIVERVVHARLGGDDVAIYGDHASIYPEPFEPEMSRFVPRVDYCTPEAWIYRRHRIDDGGYVRCAKEIVALPDWDPAFVDQSWGAARVLEASQETSEPPAGFGAPSNWIAARINMHIERQATMVQEADGDFDEDDLIG